MALERKATNITSITQKSIQRFTKETEHAGLTCLVENGTNIEKTYEAWNSKVTEIARKVFTSKKR